MTWQASPPVPILERPQREERVATDAPGFARARAALFTIPWQDFSYDGWFRLACSFHYATGGSDEALAALNEWGAEHPTHDDDFVAERVWKYLRDDRGGAVITERTLFATAKQYGWVDPLEPDVADDFTDLTKEEPEPAAPRDKTRFEFLPAHEFTAGRPSTWIIKDVLPRADLIVVYGESQSGKSFFALDVCGAVAQGIEWRGKRTQKLKVGYIAAEGAGGFRNRLKAYSMRPGHEVPLEQLDIVVLADAPNLMESRDVVDLGHAMRAAGVELLVVDTWAQVTPGANENSGEDMGRAIGHCRTLRKATGATILLIHHSGKDASKGARGWSGLRAAADAEIEITRCDHDRVATVTKLKDGEDGAEFGFKLLTLPVGMDDDGDVVSSCVVEHGDAGAAKAKQKRMPAGAPQKLVDVAVRELIALDGALPGLAEVLDIVASRLPFDEHSGKKDQRRRDAQRALDTLMEKGWVRCENGRYRHATNDELA